MHRHIVQALDIILCQPLTNSFDDGKDTRHTFIRLSFLGCHAPQQLSMIVGQSLDDFHL
jgi:hypothetical protein